MDNKSALGLDAFEKFACATTSDLIVTHFNRLCGILEIQATNISEFLPVLRETLASSDVRDLLGKYEKRLGHKTYANGGACRDTRVLIIGAGPCGLRTAIEAQLLGARVLVIEKRLGFTRRNVLHLWPFVMTDLKELGAKRFCPKFCSGSIDHVSINQLQSILLKVALILGVEVHFGVEFIQLVEPSTNPGAVTGWTATTTAEPTHPVHDFQFDVVIGGDGRQKVLPGFSRKELRGKLAIAITANYLNRRTAQEAKVQEISGVSFIFRQSLFRDLCDETGIDLENFVYYKDETHYFVMTAKKQSLIWKGVLKENYVDTHDLLDPGNVDAGALEAYTTEAVRHVTQDQLPNLEFAKNQNGKPDLAIFDFTKMYAAENSCRVLERQGRRLLMGLVGDSLLEPFWPTGSGCARGFLSSMDAAWMIRSWAQGEEVLEVLAERETIYRLLAQTTHDNLNKDYKSYTADPTSRYPNLVTGTVLPSQVVSLMNSDLAPGRGPRSSQDYPIKNPTQKCPATKKCPLPPKHPSESGVTAKVLRRTGSVKVSSKLVHDLPVGENQKSDLDVDFLVEWFRVAVEPFGIQVAGIHDIFVSGHVLCGTIHSFRPDLIPEYPFPPDIEEGIEVSDAAAFRNQIAFDFLNNEYHLPYVVSGYDSVQYTMTHLEQLVFYLFRVYSVFQRGQLIYDDDGEETLQPFQKSKGIQRSATFSVPENPCDDSPDNGNGRCIRKLRQRFQDLHFVPSEPPEERSRRKRDAEKCKLKALEFISSVQERRSEEEKEAMTARRDRIVETIRAIHVTQPESREGSRVNRTPTSTKGSDDFFNEYNLRLWRKSVPSMEERAGKLRNAFSVQSPRSSTTPKLVEEVKESCFQKGSKSTKSASLTPVGATPKVNTKDWVQELLAQKFPGASPPPPQRQRTKPDAPPTSFGEEDGRGEPVLVDPNPITPHHEIDLVETGLEFAEENGAVLLDNVPERVFYSPEEDLPTDRQTSPEFNENDEDFLDMLDSSELEHLEAWTGKYL